MKDMIQLRANILGGMNSYILDVCEGDEGDLTYWSAYIPKNITEKELVEIAKDERKFNNISYAFGKLLKGYREFYLD